MQKRTKTFADYYAEEKAKPTPAQAFVSRIAAATMATEPTVRIWLSGTRRPDALAVKVIAEELNADPATLFPETDNQ